MANNVKIRTPDVEEILDIKIKASNPHTQISTIANEDYDSILGKISARSPTLNEKQALDAAQAPSAGNPYVTLSQLNSSLASKIPWKTIGRVGSGSDFEGDTDAIFTTAFKTSNQTFLPADVNTGTDTITIIGHGYVGSDKVIFSSTGVLPAGLLAVTTYYVINATANTFQVSLTNGGAAVDITSTGTGIHTVEGGKWFQVREGVFTFAATVTIPAGLRVVGTSPAATHIVGNLVALPLFQVSANVFLSYMTVEQQSASGSAISVIGNEASLENLIATSLITGLTIVASAVDALKLFSCVSTIGQLQLGTVTDSFVHGCLFDAPTIDALLLTACDNISVTSSIFKNGVFSVTGSNVVKAVANHFNDGTSIVGSTGTLLRANTPNTYNNEIDDFANLLSYIGSPSITTLDPPFSNNYGGPPGDDLTARASGLDLLTQWRYEERNFHLMADTEPMTVTWSPSTNILTTSGAMRLLSSHRASYWNLATIAGTNIPTGFALYYIIDRNLNASPITLTPLLAPLGSIPNDRDNRQVWVLAFALGTTLWWRGGGGSRFPGTGAQTGTYFVDGSSKSLLDFIGATDYNDSDPNYSSNFTGIQGESLVVRLGKTDTLIKRLFQYSNHGIHLSDAGFIQVETGPAATYRVTLTGTWYMSVPDVAGRFTSTGPFWDLNDGDIVYFTLDTGSLAGVDLPITASAVVANGALPLPDAYPLGTKYFVFARRVGTSVFLWDDSELPVGGRYPVPIGRTVVPTSAPALVSQSFSFAAVNAGLDRITLAAHGFANGNRVVFTTTGTLPGGITAFTNYYVIVIDANTFQISTTNLGPAIDITSAGTLTHTVTNSEWTASSNVAWDGTDLRWQDIKLAVATGQVLARNSFADQTFASAGLTNLAEGEGLLVTHTWNSGANQNVTVAKVVVPLVNQLNQNQFLWVQRRNGYIVFTS